LKEFKAINKALFLIKDKLNAIDTLANEIGIDDQWMESKVGEERDVELANLDRLNKDSTIPPVFVLPDGHHTTPVKRERMSDDEAERLLLAPMKRRSY
jgi:hypothetical protein